MRRFFLTFLALILLPNLLSVQAQGKQQNYRSDVLGFAFQYPAGWQIREQLNTQTVLVASEPDLKAVAQSQKPAGLIFSVTITTFRQIGARSLDDFAVALGRVTGAAGLKPVPIRLGGADGLMVEETSTDHDLATRTAVLSIGRRRIAILRGVTTMTGWVTGGKETFDQVAATLSFFPPPDGVDIDGVGAVLWQLSAEQMPELSDLTVSSDGTTVYAVERNKGIWKISANGIGANITKPAGIGAFGGYVVLRDGAQYISDPANHALWLILPGAEPRRIAGGTVGTGRGAFGPDSPRQFTFAPRFIYMLDENEGGPRIQLFSFTGNPVTFWPLSNLQKELIQGALMAADSEGGAYILGKNTDGIYKLNAAGTVVKRNIGREALTGSEPLALAVDRFDNFYVATADQGILHLDVDGNLIGIIGEPYDESAPPKPGQLARPVALALTPGGGPMYVADVGKHPQIVAFALDGNTAVSLEAGMRDAGALKYGETVKGAVNTTAFLFNYTFEGKAGDVVTITMTGENLDVYLDLLNAEGKLLAANDDAKVAGLGATDAQIKEFRLPHDGTYTIRATRFGREASRTEGNFTLSLEVGK